MSQVFISYAHEDYDFAELIIWRLKEAGLDVWIDENIPPGTNWSEEIDIAIKESFALIVIITPASMKSENVSQEWKQALYNKVSVIPIILKSTELDPELSKLQYLEFVNRKTRPWMTLIDRLQLLKINLDNKNTFDRIPPSVQRAIDGLDSLKSEERYMAIETLSDIDHPAALQALVQAVEHPIREVRILASLALAVKTNFQTLRPIPGLLEAIDNKYPDKRQEALLGLHEIAQKNKTLDLNLVLPKLIETLEDADADIRWLSEHILIILGEPAIKPLIATLRNENRLALISAIDALGCLAEAGLIVSVEEAIPDLVKLTSDFWTVENARDRTSKNISNASFETLVKIGTPTAKDELLRLLNESHIADVRILAAIALGDLRDPIAIPDLFRFLQSTDSSYGRNVVIKALEKIGVVGIPMLLKGLNDPNSLIQCVAIWLLGKLNAEQSVSAIKQCLADETVVPPLEGWSMDNERVCDVAAAALKHIGTPEAIEAVKHWQQEQNGKE